MAALDHVKQVRIDAVGDEALAVVVEIDAPGIGGAVGEVLEHPARGVDAVDAAVAVDALVGGRAGRADVGGAGPAMSGIEPAVRAPGEAVGEVVPAFLVAEAVEDDLGLAAGLVVPFAAGDEVEFGRRHHPDAAEADLDAGDVVEALRRRPCG